MILRFKEHGSGAHLPFVTNSLFLSLFRRASIRLLEDSCERKKNGRRNTLIKFYKDTRYFALASINKNKKWKITHQ